MSCPIDLPPAPEGALTYGNYLRVPELLSLQTLQVPGGSHDELLFIVIHQAYELWFKQILFELDTTAELLAADDLAEATRLLERVSVILQLLVQQIHVLDTMRPRDFCHFRRALTPASGFQSNQFRELEFLTGLRDERYLAYLEDGSDEHARLVARMSTPSLRDRLHELLGRRGFSLPVGPPDELDRDAVAAVLFPIYNECERHADLYRFCEALVQLDQQITLWRFHHLRVVERIIGTKYGTGGSPGVPYLAATLQRRAFPELWDVRARLDDDALFRHYAGPGAHAPSAQ
jgi:tryptophan 2,3-dioxygenase